MVSDTAAALSTTSRMASAAVTPWRLEALNRARELVAFIQEHAEPERQFQTATEISQDIVHAVKTSLRQQYGRVFDPLIDGPEPKASAS